MVNGDMALANSKGHNDSISVLNTAMLLRERINRLMAKGVPVSWKSLPEVKSSGLLETLTERQMALEELKFCLITREVVYNRKLVELIGLSKQSVSLADSLPKFNRRSLVTAIERVKRCSDQFLDAFEKHWNMTPAVSLTVLNKILQDLAPQFQHYLTYCTHQEDLSTVLHTAMRSSHLVVEASFSDQLNLESVMLPLQHLKLYCLLLNNIHSVLISTTNHLENFHCNRILADITKLFEECYKLLVKMHGPQYIENIDRLLDKSVHGFERDPRGNTISNHQKSFSVDPKIVCRKEATDSVHDTDGMTSEVCTLVHVNKHKSPSVKEQWEYFELKIVETKKFRDVVKFGDKYNTLKRQECDKVGWKKAVDCTSEHRPSQFIIKKCAIFEGAGPRCLCKRQNCYRNSRYSVSHFTDIINISTATDRRRRSLSVHEIVCRSLGDNAIGSEKHTDCWINKLNISVDNKRKPSIICSSSSSSNNSDNNNTKNSKPPKSTSLIITDYLPKLSRNSTKSAIESFHDSDKVEKHVSNKLQSSIVQNQTIPFSVLQNNPCQKVLEECDAVTQLDSRLITPTSAGSCPFKVQYKTIKTYSLGDNQDADGLQTESWSCICKVKIEVQCPPLNEEEKLSEHGVSLSNLHYGEGSPSSDMLSSVTKEISYTEELSIDVGNMEQLPENEELIFVSSCNPHYTSSVHLPSEEESVETDELYNDYQPMNESFRRNCYQFKPVTPSELLNKNASGADDIESEYEEWKPLYMNVISSGIYKNSMLSAGVVPLYQVYDFGRVTCSNTTVEENVCIEPDEHVYEEITFYEQHQPESNGQKCSVPGLEESQPLGNNQHLQWVNIAEVANSGLLDEMDAKQIALQEAKYEIISSESSYFKSLLILETLFITSKELTDTAVLGSEDHTTLFSSVRKAKECSEKFLNVLLDGWPEDLKLNYLCHAVSKFVSSGTLQVYVDCCASQINIEKTLQQLMLTNSEFTTAVLKLQADPVCKTFSLQSFLILPMQRVTRLPLLVQAILKHLPSDHAEHSVWTDILVHLQKIVEECDEAVGRAEALAAEHFNDRVLQPDIKKSSLTLNHPLQGRMKKQTRVWKIFGRARQRVV